METLWRLDRPDALLDSAATGAKSACQTTGAYSIDGADLAETEGYDQELYLVQMDKGDSGVDPKTSEVGLWARVARR